MKILGMDLGYSKVGYALVCENSTNLSIINYGMIETDSNDHLPNRLFRIQQETRAIIERFRPDAVATEKIFFSANRKTALDVAKAQGVILACCAEARLEWFEYSPTEVKMGVTGIGNAPKEQVACMVRHLLALGEEALSDDVTDAIAVAVCHIHCNRLHRLSK